MLPLTQISAGSDRVLAFKFALVLVPYKRTVKGPFVRLDPAAADAAPGSHLHV